MTEAAAPTDLWRWRPAISGVAFPDMQWPAAQGGTELTHVGI
jgi:hypothetical protein